MSKGKHNQYELAGRKWSLRELAESDYNLSGANLSTLYKRLYSGWTLQRALGQPVCEHKNAK